MSISNSARVVCCGDDDVGLSIFHASLRSLHSLHSLVSICYQPLSRHTHTHRDAGKQAGIPLLHRCRTAVTSPADLDPDVT